MKTLYFDCFSGAAGDMILGSLVDAGTPERVITDGLRSLDVPGWDLSFRRIARAGIDAMRAEVTVASDPQPLHHEEIARIIQRSRLSDGAKRRALETFELLVSAEAKIHGTTPNAVHLHEVGALDAIVDIVGVAIALEHLNPGRIVTSPIATGRGEIKTQHGMIPLPAPAVTELLKGAVLYERGRDELITPTGAAILAAATDEFGEMPPMRIAATGYGAGARDTAMPNVVRVLVGGSVAADPSPGAVLIETNLDDLPAELAAHALQSALNEGASDAWITPVVMKKGRPGWVFSILAPPERQSALMELLYRETTTFGLRVRHVEKNELDRTWAEVDVEGHPVRLKIGSHEGRVMTISPEFEDARQVAEKTGTPLKDVYRKALEQQERSDLS